MEDEQYQNSVEYYNDVKEQFEEAIYNLQADIERWYQRLADNNGVSYSEAKKLLKDRELEEFKWTVNQYIKYGKENALNENWMRELENASAKYHIDRLEAMKLQIQQHAEKLYSAFGGGTEDFLKKTYTEQFYKTAFEIAKGVEVGFSLEALDIDKIDTVLAHPWAQDGKAFSDRIWDNKDKLVRNLHNELAQNIIRGESPQKAINNLAKKMKVSKIQAGNLIMTETAAVASRARKKCFEELDVEAYEIDATLDGRTCEACGSMDRKVFKMDEYEVGVTAPPFHPRCRCDISPAFDDWEELGINVRRAARDPETGKTVHIDGNISYEEWKKKYVKDRLENDFESGTIKTEFPVDILKVKGVTPDIRNQLNKAMEQLEKEYEIQLDSVSVEAANKGDIFIVGWYDGRMAMVVNRNADFEAVVKGMSTKYASGYLAGKSLEDYVAHEMFHVMLYQDCKTEQQYRAKYLQIEGLFDYLRGISEYADRSRSGNEALAEAFVRIRNGEEVAPIVKVLVESYVSRWKK